MPPSQSCPPESIDDVAVEEILSLLADDYVRSILDALTDGPKPATEIADRCDASTVTIYRRLDRLETAGLVAVETQVAPDGNHRAQYRARPASIAVSISEAGLTGELTVESTVEPAAGDYGHRPASTVGDD
jgi:DNA-binding HxlR family transcriptional regulator